MAQQPDDRNTTLSRDITRTLTRRIVDEVYPAGSKLPTERDLALEFGVTRHVVREALKRLEALGLVSIRQGSGILVEQLQLTGGIELFRPLLTKGDGSLEPGFFRDMLEFRVQLGHAVVRLAAQNRTPEDLETIRSLVRQRRDVLTDVPQLIEINSALFRAFAQATHNRVYAMIVNTLGSLLATIRPKLEVPVEAVERVQLVLEQLVAAIEEGDEELAELLWSRHDKVFRSTMELLLDSQIDA